MALRVRVLILFVFAAAVFLLPLTALLGGQGDGGPAGQSDAVPAEGPPPGDTWPYSSAGDSSSAYPAGAEGASAGAASLFYPADYSFSYYDLTEKRVLTIPARDYVRGALAAEMPASFHAEALKAQAVSAHTYALYCAEMAARSPDSAILGADFSADPQNRKGFITESEAKALFGGQFDYYWGKICAAADEGLGYALLYEGEPILAAYHASSVGMTEAAENVWPNPLPYLVPVESAGDFLSPGHKTEVRMTDDAVKTALKKAFPNISLYGPAEGWILPTTFSSSGYILEANVGDMAVSGSALRFALLLRSSSIEILHDGDGFCFTTTGYGHGVGLSQYGADYLARQGQDFKEILLHYYPGTMLGEVVYG